MLNTPSADRLINIAAPYANVSMRACSSPRTLDKRDTYTSTKPQSGQSYACAVGRTVEQRLNPMAPRA